MFKQNILKTKKFIKLAILASIFIFLIVLANIPFLAEYMFARGITRAVSFIISRLTTFLPFSLYEILAYVLILAGLFIIGFSIYLAANRKFLTLKRIWYIVLVVALTALNMFILTYAPLYKRESVAKALNIEIVEVDNDNLKESLDFYLDKLVSLNTLVKRDSQGNSIMPYDFSTLCEKLNSEYKKLTSGYFNKYSVSPKKVLSSEVMSYLGISGIYFPFTAEANINMNEFDMSLPQTVAHELAHSKGIALENEANFMSYYILIMSDDIYLQYSGYLHVSIRLLNTLYSADRDSYDSYRKLIPEDILRELSNESEFYESYEGFVSSVSNFFNNLFLKSNGVSGGTKSYSLTSKFIVSLYYTYLK